MQVQSTVLEMTLIVSALPCAAWSSCRGTKHCLTIDSYCQCFNLVLHGPLAEVQSTVTQFDSYCWCFTLYCMVLLQKYKVPSHNWLLLYCTAWLSCRGTKHCSTIDLYYQCFTLCSMVLLQRYIVLSYNWLLLSVLLQRYKALSHNWLLLLVALPCAAWSSCRAKKRYLTIDSYCQCFTLCWIVLWQRYKALS
jgi:hypothetical protein